MKVNQIVALDEYIARLRRTLICNQLIEVLQMLQGFIHNTMGARLVVELAVERQANSLCQQACVLIACGIGDDGDVTTGNHLRRVSVHVRRCLCTEFIQTYAS